jgi:hypothetical protein
MIGQFKPGQVMIRWTESTRRIVPEVETIIATRWQQAGARPGIHLFDGPMARLEAVEIEDRTLRLTLSHTRYRIYTGTNMAAEQIAPRFGRDVMANPVGLSALVLSSDGHLLMGRRNARVAYYPLRVHPFAGCLEPGETVDVFDEVRRELREELRLEESDISEIVCTGMAEDQALLQPELIFAATSHRALAEIAARLHAEEHEGIFTAAATQKGVEAALRTNENFTPIARAAMLLWGRTQFGGEWMTRHTPP